MDYKTLVEYCAESRGWRQFTDPDYLRGELTLAEHAATIRAVPDLDAGELFVEVDKAALRNALADAVQSGDPYYSAVVVRMLADAALNYALPILANDVEAHAEALREEADADYAEHNTNYLRALGV